MRKKTDENIVPEKTYKALFRKLSRIASVVGKKTIRVVSIPEGDKALGYTSADRVIHLNPNHELVKDLNVPQRIKFIKGVWTHEMMHQLITNFMAASILKKENKYEDYIYHEVFNIVEDARIENLAPNYIGGIYTEDVFGKDGKLKQMSDLTYSKRVVYKNTDPIDALDPDGNPPEPLAQVICAMIQYGDSGVIKGKFLDEQAEKIFAEILPLYDEITEEYNFQTVLQKSIKITEIMRPLWEDDAKALDQLKKMMEQAARDNHSNNKNRNLDSSKSGNGSSSESQSLASKSRKATRKKISAEEASKMLENDEVEAGNADSNAGEEYEVEDPENLSEKAKEKLKNASKGSSGGASADDKSDEEKGNCSSDDTGEDSSGDMSKDKSSSEGEASNDENDGEGGKGKTSETDAEESSDENEASNGKESDESESSSDKSKGEKADGNDGNGSQEENGGTENSASEKGANSGKGNSSEGNTADSSGDNTDSSLRKQDTSKGESNEEKYKGHNKGDYTGLGSKATKGAMPDSDYYKKEGTSENENDEFLDDVDDYEIPESEISSVMNELNSIIKSEEAEEKRLEDDYTPVEVNVSSKYFSNASVINRNVKVISTDSSKTVTQKDGSDMLVSSSYEEYEAVTKSLRPYITGISRQFERLFKNKSDERYHKTTGKINIPRMNSGRITSRIFDKTVSGNKATDIAMYLCIDESGSMCHKNRYEYAKLTAIGLAEMCEKLKIPLYVMGFTADEGSGNKRYDAVHMHYIKWKNNKRTRLNLLTISARSNNFDGYSIRYATKILNKRPENHKILIVISDGAPAAYRYSYGSDGIEDTKLAIKEANRSCTALGVAIGGDLDNARIKEMYGTNFLSVPDVSTLFQQLAAKLRKMIKEDI